MADVNAKRWFLTIIEVPVIAVMLFVAVAYLSRHSDRASKQASLLFDMGEFLVKPDELADARAPGSKTIKPSTPSASVAIAPKPKVTTTPTVVPALVPAPVNTNKQFDAALKAYNAGDLSQLDNLNALAASTSSPAKSYAAIGWTLSRMNNFEAAASVFAKALGYPDVDNDTLMNYAVVLARLNNFPKAEAITNKILLSDPGHRAAVKFKGVLEQWCNGPCR